MDNSIIEHQRLSSIVEAEDERIKADPKRAIIEKNVECKLVRNYLKRGKAREFVFDCDEPVATGGENSAPQATEYFLAGAGFCELSLFARYAALLHLKVESIEVTVHAKMNRHVYWTKTPVKRIGQIIPGFMEISFDTKIKSNENKERIRELADEVEGRCPIYAALKNPTQVSNRVFLNGELVKRAPCQMRTETLP